MDAVAADFDGDGDQDLVIAHEYRRTIFLLNDGTGVFEDASARFPDPNRDSEDLAVTDWDGDGALDVLIVSEDDTANELFLQRDGAFVDASERLPNEGISNGVAWAKLAGDDVRSVFVGNNGQNRLWVEDGQGGFVDATDGRMPVLEDATQDLELGDLDGDGDLDLVVGNEGDNLILFQDAGVFTLAPDGCLPLRQTPEETRDVELGDIDADGDLDLVFGNVLAFVPGASPLNRVLVNQGDGCFTDETAERWQTGMRSTFDADRIDVDAAGDLDLGTGNLPPRLALRAAGSRVSVNHGEGVDTAASDAPLGGLVERQGVDIEAIDADGAADDLPTPFGLVALRGRRAGPLPVVAGPFSSPTGPNCTHPAHRQAALSRARLCPARR